MKRIGAVATCALLAKATFVRVVFGVASAATSACDHFGVALMAACAAGFYVCAGQRERGSCMIEIPQFPVTGVVALRAITAETVFVWIIIAVAADTARLRIAKQ